MAGSDGVASHVDVVGKHEQRMGDPQSTVRPHPIHTCSVGCRVHSTHKTRS